MRIVFFLFLLLSMNIHAQNTFNNLYDFDLGTEGLTAVTINDQGEILTFINSIIANNSYHILKIGLNGDTIWAKNYEGEGLFYGPGLNMIENSLGGLFIPGSLETGIQEETEGILIKTDVDGDTLWIEEYGGSDFDVLRFISMVNDTTFVLSGMSITNSDVNYWMLETDTLGQELWSITHGNDQNQVLTSAELTHDSAYLMAGITDTGFNTSQKYIVKTDLDGALIWEDTFGNNKENGGYILPLENGDFYLASSRRKDIPGGWEVLQPNLYKFNSEGDELWEKSYSFYNGFTSAFLFTTSPIMTNNALYIAGNISNSSNKRQGFLMKLTSDGDSLWTRKFNGNPDFNSYVLGLQSHPDGGFVLSGTAFGFEPTTTQDGWVVKVDSLGCLVPGCAVDTEEFEREHGYFQLGPNPAHEVLNVFVGAFYPITNGRIIIKDAMGKIVLSQAGTDSDVTHMLDVSHLHSGLYTISLEQKGAFLQTEKFIKN